jgi:beta-glucoside operon transcriptional antiterminator
VIIIQITKALNNNLILAKHGNCHELVIFGKGIGFNKRIGDTVDEEKVTKIFISQASSIVPSKLLMLPPEVLDITAKIMKRAEVQLEREFGLGVFAGMADTINQIKIGGLKIDDPFKYEIRHLYKREYTLAAEAIQLMQNELNLSLGEDEIMLIASHFVYAQLDSQGSGELFRVNQVILEAIRLIQSVFDKVIDTTSIDFSRFITHLRFLMVRQMPCKVKLGIDQDLQMIFRKKYQKSYACGLAIQAMMERDFNLMVSDDELTYLIIHIERLTSKT